MIIASSRFRRKTPRVPGRIPNVSRRSSQSSGGWMLLLRGPACHAELPRSVAEGRICLPESTIWPGLGRLRPACSESGTQSSRVIPHRNTKQLHRCCSQRSMACGPTAGRPALVPYAMCPTGIEGHAEAKSQTGGRAGWRAGRHIHSTSLPSTSHHSASLGGKLDDRHG